MKRPAAKRKITDLDRSRLVHRASGSSHSYLKTRVRASRLYEAAFILAFIELSRRLHQAYRQAYDKQAVDWLFPQKSAMDIARQKNCATPNSLVEYFKKDLEAQWDRTSRSREENGSLLFYEKANNTYPRVTLSEGRHLTDRISSVPSMPEIGPETRKALDDFQQAGRSVYLLAFFHTHPNFPGGDSRSGRPSGDDIQYQSDHGNALGIIRTGKGYSFFSNGRTFLPGDARANDCVWNLNN